MNIADAVGVFLAAVAGEVSPSTRTWYARCLGVLVAFAGSVPLSEADTATLRAYRAFLVESSRSAHTIHGYQRAARRLFSWLQSEGLIQANPAAAVPLVRLPSQIPKALSDADMLRLLERLPYESVRDRSVILFLIDTGCRAGGLCSLTLESVNVPERTAEVVEKGRRGRRVYYTDLTADALALWLAARPAADTAALWTTQTGRPLTPNAVRLMLERVGKRAGVKGRCNAHSFRHAFARSFLRNGGNLAALGRILGHEPGSPVTAKYYAVFDDRELQDFHARYSPLAGQDSLTTSQPLIEAVDNRQRRP